MSRPSQGSYFPAQAPPDRGLPGSFPNATPPAAAGIPPTSFKTNVNRAKTKRWVEAKSYSYDGDDWGDADDYDDYGGYDEATPPARPTGFRQPGQVIGTPSPASHPGSGVSEGGLQEYRRKDYKDLPGLSTGPRKQDGTRSATNPVAQSMFPHGRTNSFDRDDEKRSFSAGGLQSNYAQKHTFADPTVPMQASNDGHPLSTQVSQMGLVGRPSGDFGLVSQPQQSFKQDLSEAPSLQVQTQFPTYCDQSATNQVTSPISIPQESMHREQPRQATTGSRTHSITSNTSSIDLHNRRDFSPSALPPPLHPRASPGPQSAKDDSSTARFPPRKSSLSQQSAPYAPNLAASTQSHILSDGSNSAGVTQVGQMSSSRDRTSSNAAKPLPFVRPADIYKRLEEEREKERRSQESGRPSMDSIMGRPSNDDIGSAAGSTKDFPLPDIQGRGIRRKISSESTDGDDSGRKLKPVLDPVTERKSEYGLEGFAASDPNAGNGLHSAASKLSENTALDRLTIPNTTSTNQDKPVLPNVSRVSGFGDDFMKDNNYLSNEISSSKEYTKPGTDSIPNTDHLSPQGAGETEQQLQHQPSLGFRSVVNQAFDRPEDRSVPPTPSSMGGSGVARTNSESTTGVSPIMSRVPSVATVEAKARVTGAREIAAPSIAEEANESSSRPTSLEVGKTSQQRAQKVPSPQSVRNSSVETLPHPFRPGHRRDLSTPSPGNSPARSPAVESIQALPHAEQVEMANATPVEDKPVGNNHWPHAADMKGNSKFDYAAREADSALSVTASPGKGTSNVADSVNEAQSFFSDSRRGNASGNLRQSRPESPIARNESPTKGKVRDLADRFEAGGSSRRGSAASIPPKGGIASSLGPRGGDLTPPRPLADRTGSFRPRLPGGWESYATTSGMVTPGTARGGPAEDLSKATTDSDTVEEHDASATTPTLAQRSDQAVDNGDLDITPTTVKRTLSMAQVEAPTDPFTAAAAAGSALAGAIAAAVGLDYNNSDSSAPDREEENHRTSNSDDFGAARGKSMTMDAGALLPKTSESLRPTEESGSVSPESSISPTPPLKDLPLTEHSTVQPSDYFPPVVPLQPGSVVTAGAYQFPVRPPMLPSLSTESGPQDYESDRLRKEIVRSLSPRTSRIESDGRSKLHIQQTHEDGPIAELRPVGQVRESTVLPKEYESYWNGSSDEDDVRDQSPHLQGGPQAVPDHDSRPALLPHRFSWEQDLQQGPTSESEPVTPAQPQEDQVKSTPPSSEGEHSLSPDGRDVATEAPPGPLDYTAAVDTSGSEEGTDKDLDVSRRASTPLYDKEVTKVPGVADDAFGNVATTGHRSQESVDHDILSTHEGGLEVAKPNPKEDFSSNFDRQSFPSPDMSHHTPRSPSDQHGEPAARDSFSEDPIRMADMSPSLSSPAPVSQPKILAFREILALKSPGERIQAYNHSRRQFANMDTGLHHWITTTMKDLPEHADPISRNGKFDPGSLGHRPSPSRGRLLKSSPTTAAPTQQPYYQQYLNASSQPVASGSTLTLPSVSGSGSQGFSPSGPGAGTRMTSQQVQAKGKDLLHSAGMLGGKANIAAKGLFSKGKSKFRGSGGVEKVVSQRNDPRAMQKSQPQLAGTPPPYFGAQSQTRPQSVFDDPYRERPFSTVLPERPYSYAHYDDFDRPPATPPNREIGRLGVLPSPTVDATPTNINGSRAPASDDTSKESTVKDDSLSTSRSVAGMVMGNPALSMDESTRHSSSRSSSKAQTNPAMVGDVPVYLKRSVGSQVSTRSSENGLQRRDIEEEMQTPRQSDFPGLGEQSSSITWTPSGTRSQDNGISYGSQPQNQSSSLIAQPGISRNSDISSEESFTTPKIRQGVVDRESPEKPNDAAHLGFLSQSNTLPMQSPGQDYSPHISDFKRSISDNDLPPADATQGSARQSRSFTPQTPALEEPPLLRANPINYPTERSVSPLGRVLDAVNVANVNAYEGEVTDLEREDVKPFNLPKITPSSIDNVQTRAENRSNNRHSRSPDVSPERQYERVNDEPAVQQQNRSSHTQEGPPGTESGTQAQSQRRPFSFIHHSTDEPMRLSQEYIPQDQYVEPNNRSPSPLHHRRKSSSNGRPAQSGYPYPPGQPDTSRLSQNEYLRHNLDGQENSAASYQHQPSRSLSDPTLLEHPAYRQRQKTPTQDPPSNYYPAETRREQGLLPRHSGTEYQLTGVGPPPAEQNEQKRRLSSRGSSFLRGLGGGNSSRPDIPTLPSAGGHIASDGPTDSRRTSKIISKRASIFRSFTRGRGSESGQSNDSMVAHAPGSSADLLRQPGTVDPPTLQNTAPDERGPSDSNLKALRKRLQRRSEPGVLESTTGKKKRFSIRNLFALFNSSKHSAKTSTPSATAPQRQSAQSPPPAQRPTLQPQHQSAYFAQSAQPYTPPPPINHAIPPIQNPGQPPPIGGYYAPEIRTRTPLARTFVGGRRLSEQQVGEAKHGFESQTGFRGPYHGSNSNPATAGLWYQTPGNPSYYAQGGPSVPTNYQSESSHNGAGNGIQGVDPYQYSQPTSSHYAQYPSYNQRIEPSDYNTASAYNPPHHHVSPQPSRPDLPSQYSTSSAAWISPLQTPQPTYTDPYNPMAAYQPQSYQPEQRTQPQPSWTPSPPRTQIPQPSAEPPRPQNHRNFSLHHRVDSPSRARDEVFSPSPPAPAPPAVPPKDDVKPLPLPRMSNHSHNKQASTKAPIGPSQNLITQLSSNAAISAPSAQLNQRAGVERHYQHQRHPKNTVPTGTMPELDAGSRRKDEEEEEEIVMSGTSYPGQEWTPSSYGHGGWEDD